MKANSYLTHTGGKARRRSANTNIPPLPQDDGRRDLLPNPGRRKPKAASRGWGHFSVQFNGSPVQCFLTPAETQCICSDLAASRAHTWLPSVLSKLLCHRWCAHLRTCVPAHTHMHIHTHTYAHTQTCAHTNMHTHTHKHAHTHKHVHTNIHSHTHTHTSTCNSFKPMPCKWRKRKRICNSKHDTKCLRKKATKSAAATDKKIKIKKNTKDLWT